MMTPYPYHARMQSAVSKLTSKPPNGLILRAKNLYLKYQAKADEGEIVQMSRAGVAAAALYVAGNQMGLRLLQAEVAPCFGVSEPTLRKACTLLLTNIITDKEWRRDHAERTHVAEKNIQKFKSVISRKKNYRARVPRKSPRTRISTPSYRRQYRATSNRPAAGHRVDKDDHLAHRHHAAYDIDLGVRNSRIAVDRLIRSGTNSTYSTHAYGCVGGAMASPFGELGSMMKEEGQKLAVFILFIVIILVMYLFFMIVR